MNITATKWGMSMNASLKHLGIATIAGLIIGVCLVSGFVAAFHAPKPHDLPVAIVAPPAAQDQLRETLAARVPGVIDLRTYDSPIAAEAAILNRDVQGAFVAGQGSARLIVAGASGTLVTQALTGVFQTVAATTGQQLDIKDIRPLPEHDRAGVSAFFLIVSIVISSLFSQILVAVLAKDTGTAARVGALFAFAGLVALLNTWIADSIIGALTGHFWGIVGLSALLSLAIASVTAGLQRLFGPPGIGLAALTLIIVGMPASGGPLGYQFLPGFFRALSQGLPPGATLTALRNTVYFDAHAVRDPILVLLAWAVAGLLAIVAADWLRARSRAGASSPDHASRPLRDAAAESSEMPTAAQ